MKNNEYCAKCKNPVRYAYKCAGCSHRAVDNFELADGCEPPRRRNYDVYVAQMPPARLAYLESKARTCDNCPVDNDCANDNRGCDLIWFDWLLKEVEDDGR